MSFNFISIPVDELNDIFLEEGIIPDAKFQYRWDTFSKWQIDNLIELGLKPNHKLLDVRCGPLRLGIQAISYLDEGNYFGIDGLDKFIKLAPRIAEAAKVTKKYKIVEDLYFNFEIFNTEFDFAIAQSVFTHLSQRQIRDCMNKMKKVMKPGSKFLFTNIITNKTRGFLNGLYGGYFPMIAGTFCTEDFYQKIAEELNITFKPDIIPHPTQQAYIYIF